MLLIFFRGTQKEIFIRNCSENICVPSWGKKNAANSLEQHWIGSFLFWRKIMVTFSCFFFYLYIISKPAFRNDYKFQFNTSALAHEDLLIVAVEMAGSSNILKAY